jgi:hypothetical protein
MSVLNDGAAFTKGILGIRVSRATAALPQTAQAPLFTITGGRIALMAIVGEVTTAIQAQANGTQLVFNPSGTGADTDLCTDLDITGDAVGTYYTLPAAVGSAMVDGLWFVPIADAHMKVLGPGAVELDCAASNTGSVKWDMWYVPLDDGASVAAA